jgi:hypothetical protein
LYKFVIVKTKLFSLGSPLEEGSSGPFCASLFLMIPLDWSDTAEHVSVAAAVKHTRLATITASPPKKNKSPFFEGLKNRWKNLEHHRIAGGHIIPEIMTQ